MGDFSTLYNEDKNEYYNVKDSTARNSVTELALKLRNQILVASGNNGGAQEVAGYGWYNVVNINEMNIIGYFSPSIDGALVRVIFYPSTYYNYDYPLLFHAYDGEAGAYRYFQVFRDPQQTEVLRITGDEVIDFVYNKYHRCFYMVNGQKATETNYGSVKLSSSMYSTATDTAATSAAVNAVRELIGSMTGVDIQIVATLPTVDISTHTLYLVPKATAEQDNIYDEYVNTDGTSAGWELIGDTSVDLSNYYNKTEADALLADKVDKVTGKGLSSEDYTTAEKTKLAGIAAGAEANVQSDWSQADTTADDYIKNKPSIPTATSDLNNDSGFIVDTDLAAVATSGAYNDLTGRPTLATVATSGSYNDLSNKPTIPAAQVNSDWNAASGVAQILNKPNLAAVATSGSYNDLADKPTIPSGQVQSDWNQSDSSEVDYIKNKPTIPAAQVPSDWNASTGVSRIMNKPSLSEVATSGDYNDLSNAPDLSGYATTAQLAEKIDKVNGTGEGSLTIVRKSGDLSAQLITTTEGNNPSALTFAASDGYVALNATVYNSSLNRSRSMPVFSAVAQTSGEELFISGTGILLDDKQNDDVSLSADAESLIVSKDIKFNGGATGLTAQLQAKQGTLVSGSNIKTVNGNSLLGSGNIALFGAYTLPQKGDTIGQGGSYPSALRYNTIGGSLTGSGMELYLFLPFPFPPSLPDLTYCRLSVRHAQNTDYAYMLEGSSRYALNASNTQSTLMENGTLRSGVDSITCGELGIHGFNIRIKFKNALAINTSGTALYNNSPVSCFLDLRGTWST